MNLKTFYGDRRVHKFEVNINDKISDIIQKLCIEEDILFREMKDAKKWNFLNQYRLYSTMGRLREINPAKSYKEELINEDYYIMLLPASNLDLSDLNRGNLILLESNNKVALKQGGDEHQMALTEQGYSFGRIYCEVILETEPYEKSVIIGISQKRTDFNLNPNDVKGFWGFVLSDCKKVSNNASGKVDLIEYGDVCKIGDRVGMLMEFNSAGLDITYYINKINMGVAFKSLHAGMYYPAIVLGFDGTKVRLTNKVLFPDI